MKTIYSYYILGALLVIIGIYVAKQHNDYILLAITVITGGCLTSYARYLIYKNKKS